MREQANLKSFAEHYLSPRKGSNRSPRYGRKGWFASLGDRLKYYWLPILSGLLIGTSYIPFPPWALFFCLVPLWIFLDRATSARSSFWAGWTTQFVLNLIGFHWVAYTVVVFGQFPYWFGLGTLLFFAAFAHLYFAFAACAWFLLKTKFDLTGMRSLTLLFALFGLFQLTFPALFPWHFGYPWLWAKLPGVQTADIFGFDGLNLITIFANTLLAFAWIQFKRSKPKAISSAVCAILLIGSINVWGLFRKEVWSHPDSKLNILAVQGNIGDNAKLEAEKGIGQDYIVQKFMDLTSQGITTFPQTEVVIWPETAFPDALDPAYQHRPATRNLLKFLADKKMPLWTGAYSADARLRETYNAFFVVDKEGRTTIPPYHKTILLAFGEYVPFSRYFPFVLDWLSLSEFGRGSGPTIMNTPQARIGPQICYEGLDPVFSAALSRKGAEVFVNVTNDSWFAMDFEPFQHLYMTLARALEFRRPLMRSTNTGITTAVLANGDVLELSPRHQEWVSEFEIPFQKNAPHTFYEKIAGLWVYALAFLITSLLGWRRGIFRSFGLARNTKTP